MIMNFYFESIIGKECFPVTSYFFLLPNVSHVIKYFESLFEISNYVYLEH